MEQDDSDEHAPASPLIALPPDALARVCAYLETRAARRLHAAAKAAARARQRGLGRGHQDEPRRSWVAAQGSHHERPPDAPPPRAVSENEERRGRHTTPSGGWGLPGFHGLATDGGVDEGDAQYWCDALFRPEPWLVLLVGGDGAARALRRGLSGEGARRRDDK